MIGRLAVIGVGLIGGSVAGGLKRAGRVGEVVGWERTPANLQTALDRGLIDRAADSAAAAVAAADLVLLAAPVASIPPLLREISPALPAEATLTDVGSTKAWLLAQAQQVLPPAQFARFVPGHPIAGTEHAGAAAAQLDLFAGRTVILTPIEQTVPAALAGVRAMWQALGATVVEQSPAAHDQLLALTSHLPHVLSYALASTLEDGESPAALAPAIGGGLRDMTRIAGSDVRMWRDILLSNREAVERALTAYRRHLDALEAAVAAAEPARLEQLLAHGRALRRRLLEETE